MRAIYKRELASYFHSMIGYVFIAFILAVTGIYFMAYNLNYGYPVFSYVLSSLLFILLIAIPLLTMKSFSEDRKNKTDQLLLTAPVTLGQIVLGKYLALLTIYLIPNVIFCIYPLVIKMQGTAYLLMDYCGILVFFLMGCVYIAIGMFLSSLTESQIISAIATFAVLLVFYLWNGLVQFIPSSSLVSLIGILAAGTVFIGMICHMTRNRFIAIVLETILILACIITYIVKSSLFENLLPDLLSKFDLSALLDQIVSDSLFDVSGLIMYVSLIGLFLFLTIQSIQKRRWS